MPLPRAYIHFLALPTWDWWLRWDTSPQKQAKGQPVDECSDLYSPGARLYEMVTGKPPFLGYAPVAIIGQQDITAQVDFTSLMRLGDRHGLATVGYAPQSQFLTNLGFSSFLDALPTQDLSAARMELGRMAMMTLVDSDEYGDFKVLAQAKGWGRAFSCWGLRTGDRSGHLIHPTFTCGAPHSLGNAHLSEATVKPADVGTQGFLFIRS